MKKTEHSGNKKIIVFDLGGVIIKFSHLLICERLSDISHLPANETYRLIFNNGLESKYDTGEITSDDFYKRIIKLLKINISFKSFYNIWSDIFEENFETSKIIAELKDRHYKLILLSNTNEMHFNFVKKKFGIVNIFDDYILSYKVGCKKPDINIFKEVFSKTGAAPVDHIYIDDTKENVIAARSTGMAGIDFQNANKLKEDLAYLLQD
jgi:glucose-1-phosphatase